MVDSNFNESDLFMRIMILNSLYYPYRVGGAEISVQLLAEQLVKLENEVKVITLHDKKEIKTDFVNGVEVTYLPLKNIYWGFPNTTTSKFKKAIWHFIDCYNFEMKKMVSVQIAQFKPDIVHTNNICGFSVSAWDAVKKAKVKLVHTSRDYYLFHPNSTLFKSGKVMSPSSLSVLFWSWFKKIKSNKVDNYIGISKYITNLHKDCGFFKKATSDFIYNSVTPYVPKKNESDKIRIGFIGRLSVEKGFDVYCKVARQYKDVNELKFYAAGNFQAGNDSNLLKKDANESSVDVLGYMDLAEFLELVDIVILPLKWNEPFGRTVVECALAGKFVITTSMGAMIELAQIMPNVAIINDIEHELDIFQRYTLHQDLADDVKQLFDPDNIAKQYINHYKK